MSSTKVRRFEGTIQVKGFRIAYVLWIPIDDTKNVFYANNITIDPLAMTNHIQETMVCFHGWLDNANSYATLAPLLCTAFNMRVIGIDLPGHGKSTHSPLGYYDATLYTTTMIRIMYRLHLKSFHLMGHSLSGIFLPYLVPVLEESKQFAIKSLICIEQFGAIFNHCNVKAVRIDTLLPSIQDQIETECADSAESEQKTMDDNASDVRRLPRLYDSVDEIVRSRIYVTENRYPGEQTISSKSAKLILQRNVGKLIVVQSGSREKQTKYYLRFDPKLHDGRNTMRNVFVYDLPTMRANVIKKAQCPMLAVFGDRGWPWTDSIARIVEKEEMDNFEVIKIKGSHHLHADDPETFVKTIHSFLSNAIQQSKPKAITFIPSKL